MNKPTKPIFRAERRTNPLVWLLAIVCAILAITVIVTGAVVFAIYMIYQPKTPDVRVAYAQLLPPINYNQFGVFSARMSINMVVENGNKKVHTTFSEFAFFLMFRGVILAKLGAAPFNVPKNSSLALNYQVVTAEVPLDSAGMEDVNNALNGGPIVFDFIGQAKTRWKVGFVSLGIYTHLDSKLKFFTSNGSSIVIDSRSKSG